jgi:DNA-binding CsgD family transcriptional regulator
MSRPTSKGMGHDTEPDQALACEFLRGCCVMTMAGAASSLRVLRNARRLVSGLLHELGVLQAERQRSTRGELRVSLVLGDAGAGKTRLATELLPRRGDLAVGLTAHSCLFRGIPPVSAWAEALGLRVDGPDNDRACHVCGSGLAGLPGLGSGLGFAHDADSCAQALRYHVVEWFPGLLSRASAQRPIVVLLEDAHHSHDAVWEMLLRLARDFPASRVFVLATARPAELARNRGAREVLHALEQDAQLCRVQLAPLSRDDVGELAVATLGRGRVPAALVDWLMAHAQGNPRFTVGLLETLVERGADLKAPCLCGVPEKLARWIRAELARLDAAALALAELLAVIGDPVDPDDLVRINPIPIDDVAFTLERLVRSGTVVEQQRDRSLGYTLAQPLTREVLYSDIGGARRRAMHRRVAAALLEAGRSEAATVHFDRAARAGDGQAIDALIGMAHRAQQRGLDSQAWTTVLTLRELLPIGDQRWIEVFDGLCRRSNGGIVDRPEHYVAEIAAVQRMRQLLPGVGNPQQQAEVRLWLAGLFAYGAGDIDAGERECRQALALYRQESRDGAALSAGIELAKIRGWSGDLHGQELAAREVLREAERAGDQQGVTEALGVLGHTLGWQGRFSCAEEVLVRSIEIAPAAASSGKSQNLAVLATLDACRGNLVSARTRCGQAAACSPHDDAVIARCSEFVELVAGDLITAQTRQADAANPADRTDLPIRLAGRAAIVAAERGALTEAHRNLHAMTRIERKALGILTPLCWWAEGAVARAEGQFAAATAAFQRAADSYSAMRALSLMGFILADLTEVAVLAGEFGTADNAAQWAQDNARRNGAPAHQMLSLLATASALIGRGRPDPAARAALRAAKGFSNRGYVLHAARARVTYATAIQRSDRRAAQEALREAAEEYGACGATLRHQQAHSLLRQLGSEGPCTIQPDRGPDALTRRERQAAELAAGGYTAAQIAAQLHIGVRTVETHLARSYRKLGVSGKQQLVRQAAEFGFRWGP